MHAQSLTYFDIRLTGDGETGYNNENDNDQNYTDCYHDWTLVSAPWTRSCGVRSNLITSILWDGLAC